MDAMSRRILLTGGSAPGWCAIAQSYFEDYLVGSEFRDSLPARVIANAFYETPNLVPFGTDVMEEYCEKVGEIVDIHRLKAVVPIRDRDTLALAYGHDDDIPVILPHDDYEQITGLMNKHNLYATAKAYNVKTGWFYHANEFDHLEHLLESVDTPFVIKPCFTSGSRGMRIVHDLATPFDDFVHKKPSECTTISVNQFKDLMQGNLHKVPFVITQYHDGDEYTIDCLCYKGELIAAVPRFRVGMIGGISGDAWVSKDAHYDFMVGACATFIKNKKLSYMVGFQFKVGNGGIPYLIECNPRLQGSTCLTREAGLDIPSLIVDLATEEIGVKEIEPEIQWNTRMFRTFEEWYE